MRFLIVSLLLVSMTAMGQSRVKENIKQQAVAVSEDGSSRPLPKPPKKK